jgi:hypothetical protein
VDTVFAKIVFISNPLINSDNVLLKSGYALGWGLGADMTKLTESSRLAVARRQVQLGAT